MTTVAVAPAAATRQGAPGARQQSEILSRLRKANGELAGITAMGANGQYCTEVLDQMSAVTEAVEAVAALILTDNINACLRAANETGDRGDTDERFAELAAAVRRYVRSR